MEITLTDILHEIKGLKNEMNQKFAEQDKKLKDLSDELNQIFVERIDKQSEEIAQEIRGVVEYFEKKEKIQLKNNQEFQKNFKDNKIAHAAYDARLYKLEFSQSNLESKVLELNKNN